MNTLFEILGLQFEEVSSVDVSVGEGINEKVVNYVDFIVMPTMANMMAIEILEGKYGSSITKYTHIKKPWSIARTHAIKVDKNFEVMIHVKR